MDILTEDMKKELRKKFNGLDTKDEKFQEQAQAIVEELIEVNKKKIGDFVAQKTVDEALEEEKEGFRELRQLMSEGVLEDIQDNDLKNSLKQQAKDGIVDEILEKVSLEKAGFLKEPQKPISVEDIIEEVLNQLEEIVEEKKKELDDEIAKKDEAIKKVEEREKLRVSKTKMNNLHQKTKTYKGTEGKKLNENVENAITDLDKQINALVAETTVDDKELQSEDLKKEKEDLIEQKNKLEEMLKSIKEKYMKDRAKDSDKSKEKDNSQEGDKTEQDANKLKEDKSKDESKDDREENHDKSEEEDKSKDSKKHDEVEKEEVINNQSSENKEDNSRNESKEPKTDDSELEKDEEKEDDNRRTKAIENRISMIVNRINPDIEPEELVENGEKIREYYKTCIEAGYTKEEMDKALKNVPLKESIPTNKKDLYDEEPFTAADLVEIGKINQIRRKYLEVTSKPNITEEDEQIIDSCEEKFDDLADRIFEICNGKETIPLETEKEIIDTLRQLKVDAEKEPKRILPKINLPKFVVRLVPKSKKPKKIKKSKKAIGAAYMTQKYREILEKIIDGDKENPVFKKYNEIIETLEKNKTISEDMIPEELGSSATEKTIAKFRVKAPVNLTDRRDISKDPKVEQDEKEDKETEEGIGLD